MDITTVFGTVIVGSNPAGGTGKLNKARFVGISFLGDLCYIGSCARDASMV